MTNHKRLKSPKFFVLGILLLIISVYLFLLPVPQNVLASGGLELFMARIISAICTLVSGGASVGIGFFGRD
jgi:hypothetical protein